MTAEAYARKFIPPEESHMIAEEIAKTLEIADPNSIRNWNTESSAPMGRNAISLSVGELFATHGQGRQDSRSKSGHHRT